MTRSFTALTITACLLIAGQVHATSPQPATPVSEQSPAAFELKGIAVGDDENATKAKLPDADCETLADGTIAQCFVRSEEHTSELQSLMRISYAVFCLKKTKTQQKTTKLYTYTIY